MKLVVVLMLMLVAALPTWASLKKQDAKKQTKKQMIEQPINCHQLISDLHDMRRAQASMMSSFVKKNTTIADALNYMAEDPRNLSPLTLKRSAKTFRDHQVREAQLVNRFETASDQLLDQVEQCLMANTRLSANK